MSSTRCTCAWPARQLPDALGERVGVGSRLRIAHGEGERDRESEKGPEVTRQGKGWGRVGAIGLARVVET